MFFWIERNEQDTLQRSSSEASYSASSITEGSGKESASDRKGSEKSNKSGKHSSAATSTIGLLEYSGFIPSSSENNKFIVIKVC
jgi:hypothetical protein